jgi:hypothetical protein
VRLGDVAAQVQLFQGHQRRGAGIALVLHHFLYLQHARVRSAGGLARLDPWLVVAHFVQRVGGLLLRVPHRGRVALLRRVNLGRQNRARLEVQRVLGRVGQVRAAVLPLGDLGIRIVGVEPVVVAGLLVFPLAVAEEC